MKFFVQLKYIVLFAILLTMVESHVFSQNMFNGTISTCDSYIYDDGGPTGDYSETNYEMTICASSGTTLYFVLESLNLGAAFNGDKDILIIYEGTGTGGPVLFDSGLSSGPSGIILSGSSCITITLNTDPSFFATAVGVGVLLGGPLGDKFGRKYVIWFSILGVAPFTLMLPFANAFWVLILLVIIGVVLASAFPSIIVYAQELLPGRTGMISGFFMALPSEWEV